MNDKVKKIAKYITNILAIVNALIIGINGVEGITIPFASQITGVISVIMAVIGTYLLSDKAYTKYKVKEEGK